MTTATEKILEAVSDWPRLHTGPGARGAAVAFFVDRREIGHLHGDRAAHFGFPRAVAASLREAGRIGPHPAFPDNPGWGARRIRDEADIQDVISILRLNYDRAVARHGIPTATAS